jgi:hypothetical protein
MRVLDDKTIGFADFAGNRQYITLGNLTENPKAHLFLIDYAHRRRIKIWGEARVVENDSELMSKLTPKGYRARPEQAILFMVEAWDSNCPQHIPQRFEAVDVAAALAEKDARIACWNGKSNGCAHRRRTPPKRLLPRPENRGSVLTPPILRTRSAIAKMSARRAQ